MLTVAIASENSNYDAQVYRALLSMLLQVEVEIWSGHTLRFSGWPSVVRQAPAFLELAAKRGIQHALLAIDNDGVLTRRIEHQPDHLPAEEARDTQDGCAECLLAESIPPEWKNPPLRCCIVVPVQTLETWLLVLKGHPFTEPVPEKRYARRVLKKDLFGKHSPPEAERTRIALDLLKVPRALELLRERPSFQRFEARLAKWRELTG